MLWGGFLFLFLYDYFFTLLFFFSIENSLFCVLNIIPYYCIYRNVIPQNLNSLLRLVVAKWTFAVWFNACYTSIFRDIWNVVLQNDLYEKIYISNLAGYIERVSEYIYCEQIKSHLGKHAVSSNNLPEVRNS